MISLPSGAPRTSIVGPGAYVVYGSGLNSATTARAATSGMASDGGQRTLVHEPNSLKPLVAAAGTGQPARRCSSARGSPRRARGGARRTAHGHPGGALPAPRQPGRARRLLPLEGGAEAAYGLLAVDLAPALAAHPADPGHRHERDDDRRHQPEQDLHLARVGD